ncbi:alkaline phosphatase family protein [Leucobacter sp. cx-42]|uniref:alkaline phosphatase family protein n=1 Tax=unclassified Leucobacter TaxID=2621730 RepID=UPI00165E94A2|nr:alkaline phosphatase family protein [Leucobacter sp. cx-42]
MRKKTVAASLGAFALGVSGVCAGIAPAAIAAETTEPKTKTLVIGIDGASFDVMANANMPNVQALQAAGLTSPSNLAGSPLGPTVSGVAWSSIATGVWPNKHNVYDNNFTAPNYAQYPDYLTRTEAAAADRNSLVVGTWGPISKTIFGAAVDERVAGGNDAGTTAAVVDRLTTGNPDDIFVHLDEVDGAGHSTGSSSQAYVTAMERADAQIGEMVRAVEARSTYAQEDWLIVVTSDHGHTPTGGHGGSSKLERKTFVIAKGAEFAAGSWRDDVKITDIAPTVLAHNGITADTAWELDGLNVDDIVPDDFDSLRPILQPAVQEKGPGDLLGWTSQAPEGWTVDNSKMPTGGAPEYSGWTFMTDDFFSNTELGQFRENNVFSRNVFAVADSDEWDDVNPKSGRNFNSTLQTPAYELNGADTVDLSFVSDYAVDGPQGAAVWLHFDAESGIPRQKLIEYPSDGTRENPVNKIENETISLPRDADGKLPKTMSVHFSYDGVNSAWWAIDQVRVTQPDAPVTPEPEPEPEPETPGPETPGTETPGNGNNTDGGTGGAGSGSAQNDAKPGAGSTDASLANTGSDAVSGWIIGGSITALLAGAGALIAQRIRRTNVDG